MPVLGNNLLKDLNQALKNRLPADWSIEQMRQGPGLSFKRPDAVLEVRGPDGKTAKLLVEAKSSIEPKDVSDLIQRFNSLEKSFKGSYPLLAVRFLTSRTQEKLREAGISYLDLAGNSWIRVNRPALFIETTGEEKNPWREERPLRTLKGAVAGRIVRALCDFFPPMGVRAIAAKVEANPGYVSRVFDLLEREDLIVRQERGPVDKVDWKGLLKRWSQEYFPFDKKKAFIYLDPRGLSVLTKNLAKLKIRYAITSSLAAYRVAPIAPPRLAVFYADNPIDTAAQLGLLASEAGANAMIALPFDEVVYERTWEKDGITFAALSQVAADLLKSPGRGPEEADALLTYMEENEKSWRS